MEALVLVDCQRLFLDPGSPAVLPGAARAAAAAARALAAARRARRPVAHVRFASRPGSPMARRWRPLPARSRWAQAWPPLDARAGELRLVKDGYSAFRGTGLAARLRRRGVRRVLLAGFMTDLCVLVSAVDAFQEGFAVRVLGSACAARGAPRQRAALAWLGRACARVL
ncbi:MAG: cysteine hydrolase [Elusimicrobia bacterium]|nr:cysteine hydrolase [Elusimicrobiota bacterium]